MKKYVIGIDQSTQGTKALLFDREGGILLRTDKSHKQYVDEKGYVEHDPEEVYANVLDVVSRLVTEGGIDKSEVACIGISNQRETGLVWNKETGAPVCRAIVWQCARAEEICSRKEIRDKADDIKARSGLMLSPYFTAPKFMWVVENIPEAKKLISEENICFGTMDSYLVYRLTGKKEFRTDYSNASRTMLYNITKLAWDEKLCETFYVPIGALPQVTDSDGMFGETTFEGLFDAPVPIRAVMGDSHGALFGQGCLSKGMMKATYGTGSSIMMNVGERPILSKSGIVSSLGFKTGGKLHYVLEGNINYTGAVITWLKDELHLIESAKESEELARSASQMDHTYLVPAFSGLGAPYFRSDVSAMFYGMSRVTGRAELVKAGLSSIAYQIADIVALMQHESGMRDITLRVDGGPTKNKWLMQLQSDMVEAELLVPDQEELSAIGVAYAAGIAVGLYSETDIFERMHYTRFAPIMEKKERDNLYGGWEKAVALLLKREEDAC